MVHTDLLTVCFRVIIIKFLLWYNKQRQQQINNWRDNDWFAFYGFRCCENAVQLQFTCMLPGFSPHINLYVYHRCVSWCLRKHPPLLFYQYKHCGVTHLCYINTHGNSCYQIHRQHSFHPHYICICPVTIF